MRGRAKARRSAGPPVDPGGSLQGDGFRLTTAGWAVLLLVVAVGALAVVMQTRGLFIALGTVVGITILLVAGAAWPAQRTGENAWAARMGMAKDTWPGDEATRGRKVTRRDP